jgi:hypothetical protein
MAGILLKNTTTLQVQILLRLRENILLRKHILIYYVTNFQYDSQKTFGGKIAIENPR